MALTGMDQALAAVMRQFSPGEQTTAGVVPSAYETNRAAASVPQWSPAMGAAGMSGNAPMAGPQSVPGQTAQPSPIMAVFGNPQSYGQPQQGASIARQGMDTALSLGMTAAMTPMLGPLAPVVGPVMGQAMSSFIPRKGGRGGQQQAPIPQLKPIPTVPIPGMSDPFSNPSGSVIDESYPSTNDQYAALLHMLQQQQR